MLKAECATSHQLTQLLKKSILRSACCDFRDVMHRSIRVIHALKSADAKCADIVSLKRYNSDHRIASWIPILATRRGKSRLVDQYGSGCERGANM